MELARQIDEMWETGALDAAVVERAIGLLDEGAIRVAEPEAHGWRVNEWVKKAILLYFRDPQGRADGCRRAPLPRQDPGQVRLRRPWRQGRAARGGAIRLVSLRRLRPHAGLREHRRLGRAADDGRHVGHRRLVCADRRRRPPRRRGRDRRGARAASGSAGDRRRRSVHRLSGRDRRGGADRSRSRDRPERRSVGVGPDHRCHRPCAGRIPGRGATAQGRAARCAAEGVSRPARTVSSAR